MIPSIQFNLEFSKIVIFDPRFIFSVKTIAENKLLKFGYMYMHESIERIIFQIFENLYFKVLFFLFIFLEF